MQIMPVVVKSQFLNLWSGFPYSIPGPPTQEYSKSTHACLLTVSRLSALLLQQPSLAHSTSSTFLTTQRKNVLTCHY